MVMRKPDVEVREVICSETGKPISKIPAWIAEVNVKFVSDEARQRHPAPPPMIDLEPARRIASAGAILDPIKDLDDAVIAIDGDEEFDESEIEADEAEIDPVEGVAEDL